MHELGTIGVQNFQAVVTSVRYAVYTDLRNVYEWFLNKPMKTRWFKEKLSYHVFNVVHVSAGDNGDVHVGGVGKSLQDVLGFGGNGG